MQKVFFSSKLFVNWTLLKDACYRKTITSYTLSWIMSLYFPTNADPVNLYSLHKETNK